MFEFVRAIFFTATTFFSFNVLNVNPISISMNSQGYEIRPQKINASNYEPLFYLCSVEVNKCSGSCNNINDPYAKLYVPDVLKKLNVKLFNLISKTNETRHIKGHKTCKCKCRLNESVCDK